MVNAQGERRKRTRGYSLRFSKQADAKKPLPPQPGRPRTRAQCHPDAGLPNSCRPCPWIGCKYHLWVDVNSAGTIYLPYGDELPERDSCALDVAEKNTEMTCAQIGAKMGFSETLVEHALKRLLRRMASRYDKDTFDDEPIQERGIWHETR